MTAALVTDSVGADVAAAAAADSGAAAVAVAEAVHTATGDVAAVEEEAVPWESKVVRKVVPAALWSWAGARHFQGALSIQG